MGQITVTKVVEGRTNLVLRVDFLGDGTGGVTDEVIFSPEDLNVVPVPKNIPTFRLDQAWWALPAFDVILNVGTIPKSLVWAFTDAGGPHVDLRSFGGLNDLDVYSVQPADTDGKLLVSTGVIAEGARGMLILSLALTNAAAS